MFSASLPALATDITVYKSPTCGCCKKWVKYMRDNGFNVETHDVHSLVPYKLKYGVTRQLASCHTATVSGYVIEGHVPAADVKRLLNENSSVSGLAVPGMPVGSPGMEGNRKDAYNVISFDAAGNLSVYSSY
jgi:hypothetical protein